MTINDKYYELLAKELTNDLSDDELSAMHQIIQVTPGLAEEHQRVHFFWHHMHPAEQGHRIVQQTEQKLGFTIHKKKPTKNNRLFAVAASLLVLLSLGFTAYQNLKPRKQATLNEYFSTVGEIKQIQLSDGTHVWLNAQSVLLTSEPFTGKNREVRLIGEAYFEVAHQPQQPFVVNSHGLATTALGTNFNISAYTGDNKHDVTLYDGKVQLSLENAPEKNIFLSPGKKATLETATRHIRVADAGYTKPAEWRNGVLHFHNEDFGTIADKLERKYQTTILIADSAAAELHFTASFDVEPLEKVFQLLQKAHYFIYKKTKNGFIITSDKTSIVTS